MNDLIDTILPFIPEHYRKLVAAFIAASPIIGRALWSLRNGGGIKGVICSIWLGTNTPAPNPSAQPASIKIPLMSLAFVCCLALAGGCASEQKVTYTAVTASHVTVDAAMTAWGDYVKKFGATPDQRAQVKQLYLRYQSSAVAVIDAEEVVSSITSTNSPDGTDAQAKLTAAMTAASQTLADLVTTLRMFGVKI